MATSLKNLRRSGALKPPIDLVYAGGGLGKTSFGASAPFPVFIQTEDGLGVIEADTFGVQTSFNDVLGCIAQLAQEEHEYKTVVVDSVGWLEPLINKQCCADNKWKDLDEPGYGKGPIAAKQYWRDFLDGITYLRNARNMGVLLLAHADIKNVEHPEVDDYGRFLPKLENKHAVAMLIEACDDVYYMAYKVSTTLADSRDKNSRKVAVGGSKRYMYTVEKPTFAAKNRWSMPEMIMLPDDPTQTFLAVNQYVPYYKAMIDGTLNSKKGDGPETEESGNQNNPKNPDSPNSEATQPVESDSASN